MGHLTFNLKRLDGIHTTYVNSTPWFIASDLYIRILLALKKQQIGSFVYQSIQLTATLITAKENILPENLLKGTLLTCVYMLMPVHQPLQAKVFL